MGSEILTRCCNKCKELKPIERFQFKKSRGRYAGTCKDCNNKHRRNTGQTTAGYMSDERLERKRKRDRDRSKIPEVMAKNIETCRRYQQKVRPIVAEANAKVKFMAAIGTYCTILTRNCVQCGRLDTLRFPLDNHHQLTHCGKCLRSHSLKGYTNTPRIIQCVECSRKVIVFGSAIRCAICSASNSRVIRKKYIKTQSSHSKRAKQRGCVYEPVNRRKVYERDRYKCYLCGIKVVVSKTYQPNQASIDHIMPISKGGAHTYSNIRTCCVMCNSIKSDSIADGVQCVLAI